MCLPGRNLRSHLFLRMRSNTLSHPYCIRMVNTSDPNSCLLPQEKAVYTHCSHMYLIQYSLAYHLPQCMMHNKTRFEYYRHTSRMGFYIESVVVGVAALYIPVLSRRYAVSHS